MASAAERLDSDELERLILACAEGDKAAFAEIFRATSPKFRAIIRKMVGCEETANDILQKGYLAIWVNAARFDPAKAKAFTWMLVVMRNKAIDALRAAKPAALTEEVSEDIVDEAPNPLAQAQSGQAARVLYEKLGMLPARMSQAVIMHVVHGYSCKEIGERFGASPNTVKSWIRRGLERLRAEMPYDTFAAAF